MSIPLRPLILGLVVFAQAQDRVSTRQQRLAELENFSKKLTSIVTQGRPEDLVPLLSYDIVLEVEVTKPTNAVEEDLLSRGQIYCRIFSTPCARKKDFLSVRDILTRQRANLRTDIRFYIATTEEDFEFAYITYSWGGRPSEYGWDAGVFVGLERIGDNWKICALFPASY